MTPTRSALWRYQEIRQLLMDAGQLFTAEQAERRVLVFENPGQRGSSLITQCLYAGIQLVLPGEIAKGHRHQAAAMRFVLESSGGYTTVEGEKTTMAPGDFVLTPSWTWHDHGSPADAGGPVIWLDGLDLPLVNMLSGSFAEHYGPDQQNLSRPEGNALALCGANMLPVGYKAAGLSAPIFTYPYSRSREALHQLQKNGPIDPVHGIKMQYINPATGGAAMATIGAFLQLLPAGFSTKPYRSSDATIYCVAEGSGQSTIGNEIYQWTKSDVFVVPNWCPVSHEANGQAILFSFSHRPVQQALGLWREQAG